MKQITEFFVWLKDIVKTVVFWAWNIIKQVFQYLVNTSFKLVFCVWGMLLLSALVFASSLSMMMFASATYSSTPQAQILLGKLKPTLERMAEVAGVEINKSLDRYEAKLKAREAKKAEWEKKEKAEWEDQK